MAGACISIDRILSKLDEYLNKNDYALAERHLLYWLGEAKSNNDLKVELLVSNELMGLYRKLGKETEALSCVENALLRIEASGIGMQVGAATTYLNAATVYKAFGRAEESIPLFYKARDIYERELESTDTRLGGLYNNMALSFVDLKEFDRAQELYDKAISVMSQSSEGDLEVAITYLNMATASEQRYGLLDAESTINEYLTYAQEILESHTPKDGYYAFVCEKCASVFGYYGWFFFENELVSRARRIYEGN